MQRITQYDGLYGEDNSRPDADYLFSERLETRSQGFDWLIKPHIHARLFQLFFIKTGQFIFQQENRHQSLEGPCLLLIPSATPHGFTYNTDVRGRILTLSDALLASLFIDTSGLWDMLGDLQCLTGFEDTYSADRIDNMMADIDEELFGNQVEKRLMLHVRLQQLLLIIYRQWQRIRPPETTGNSVALQHFRTFQQRIRRAGTTLEIAKVADELSITPVHLNRICRSVAGISAGQLVQKHILGEATKYLSYTTYSVSEIAYLLNFEYPNYFARFFRKHTGLSPTEFRAKGTASSPEASVFSLDKY